MERKNSEDVAARNRTKEKIRTDEVFQKKLKKVSMKEGQNYAQSIIRDQGNNK